MKTRGIKTLVASLVAIVISFSMLIGTTFAWFTDSISSNNNIIASGNLDVNAYWMEGNQDLTDDSNWVEFDGSSIFNYDNWEPGYVEAKHVKIANEGTLAFKYKLVISPNGPVSELANVIDVYFLNEAQSITRDSITSGTKVGTLADLIADPDGAAYGILLPQNTTPNNPQTEIVESVVVSIAFKMQENAGNEYFGLTIGSTFNIVISATQYAFEEDTFGNDYDAYAEYPALPDKWDGTANIAWYLENPEATEFSLSTAEELAGLAQLVDGTAVLPKDVNNITLPVSFVDKTVKLERDIDLNLVDENGNKVNFNPIGHSSNNKAFSGTFDGQGHTIKNMYIQNNLDAWQYEGEYYSLFAYTENAVIKNVSIDGAYISSGRNEAACIVGNAVNTTFENINISNSTLIAYNNSAGGVAAECYGTCTFKNINVDENTVIGPLWGTYDVRLGGIVGMVKSTDKVEFKNITVACKLDAINDVAANYQYWLYRYSGMLIGQVDGVNNVADPTGYVFCENVTVIYNDWVDYHYCEDADLGAGSYNCPGEYKYARVEAGTGTDGIDLSTCNHAADESHNVLIVLDQLFGGGQGVRGLPTYDGVTVIYNN